MTQPWKQLTPAQKADLIRPFIVEQKLSYSETARQLGISRLAVAGAADRNGIKSPLSKDAPEGRGHAGGHAHMMRTAPERAERRKEQIETVAKKTNGTAIRSNVRPIPALPLGTDIKAPPVKASAWDALPNTTPVTSEHNHGCTWPIGESSPQLFCGAEVTAAKGSWCPVHRKMGYRPAPPIKLKRKEPA